MCHGCSEPIPQASITQWPAHILNLLKIPEVPSPCHWLPLLTPLSLGALCGLTDIQSGVEAAWLGDPALGDGNSLETSEPGVNLC